MSNLLDGVIFAGSDGWEPHIMRRGPRKGQFVQRRKKASGIGWHYRDVPVEPVPAPVLSDAQRMLADRDLNLADPVARAVLHDALLDENRDEEASQLAGPLGSTLVIRDGELTHAHLLPMPQQLMIVQDEIERLCGSDFPFRSMTAGNPGTPVGTLSLHALGMDQSERHVPAAALVDFLRQRAMLQGSNNFGDARDFAGDVAQHARDMADIGMRRNFNTTMAAIRVSPAIAWAHAWLSRDEASRLVNLPDNVSVRSVPCNPGGHFEDRGYYLVERPLFPYHGGDIRLRAQTGTLLFSSPLGLGAT